MFFSVFVLSCTSIVILSEPSWQFYLQPSLYRRDSRIRNSIRNKDSIRWYRFDVNKIVRLSSASDIITDARKIQNRTDHEYDEVSQTFTCCPNHIAFICDGNSRWATLHPKHNNLSQEEVSITTSGHAHGASRIISTLKHVLHSHPSVNYVTMYAFSTENWIRPLQEIHDLWSIMENTCDAFYSWAVGNVVVRIIGDLDDDRIPSSLRYILKKIERDTALEFKKGSSSKPVYRPDKDADAQQPLTVCIAINYGGRKDILQASRRIAQSVSRGDIQVDDITEDVFHSFLLTYNVPEPDLIIRTGGHQRISNFLLWQCAYSELYFTDTLWPDFDPTCLDEAIHWYSRRNRNYGGRP